jgi:methylmalonyl-CoA/ethylmalonyl-CoA epimerase
MTAKINHIAIVVEDIEKALEVYQDAIGLPLQAVHEEPDEAVRVAYMPTPSGEVELIQPTTADSGVAKYLARRGEGLHHVCLEVDSLDESVKRMEAKGMEVLGQPRTNKRGDRYIFVHPKSAHGVLVELYEKAA